MKALLAILITAASAVQAAFWMEDIRHQGIASFNSDKTYTVFRNVKTFGAKGDGVTDDTAAINAAITSGNRCGSPSSCPGTTITPATVYFPPGTYLISSPIIDFYYTQIIGDPNDMPIIKGAASFPTTSSALFDGDVYMSGGRK
jgi:glucan 1,3-beta-glucosidase